MADYQYSDVAKMIDHALLTPAMSDQEIESGIDLAIAYDVASVCIMPFYVRRLAERLKGTTVKTSTVIGFPGGVNSTSTKRVEAEQAIEDGCVELDMVVNISQVISMHWSEVSDDIAAVIDVAHAAGQKVKVIFENCFLKDEHKIKLCEICSELNADWVKTSTGFGTGGATIDDLKLMRKHAGPHVQVKAAGGVRDLDTLLEVRSLGVSRVGASGTAKILDPAREALGLPAIKPTAASQIKGY